MRGDAIQVDQSSAKDEGENYRDEADDEVNHDGLQGAELVNVYQHRQAELSAAEFD